MKGKADIERAIASELFEIVPSKSQLTRVAIVRAAIHCYAAHGFDGSPFDVIAKKCDLSRTLIHRYFSDRENLFTVATTYIRGDFQRFAIAAIMAAKSPREALVAYVESTFTWTEEHSEYSKVWGIFFSFCITKPKFRKMNTELTGIGHQRIAELLRRGREAGQFTVADPLVAGKMIQTVITGALITLMTEDYVALAELKASSVRMCLEIAGW